MTEAERDNGPSRDPTPPADSRRLLPVLIGGLALALFVATGIQLAKLIRESAKEGTPEKALKIEILTPGQPFVISREEFAKASEIAERVQEMKWLREQRRKKALTREDSARLTDLERTMEGRLRDLEQGITLKVRFTNHLDEDLTLFFGPDKSRNFLFVEGPGAADCQGVALKQTLEMRHPGSHRLKPGESQEFPIKELRYGDRDQDRWLITEPGNYSVTLRFITNDILMRSGIRSINELTNTVDFKVEEEKQGN